MREVLYSNGFKVINITTDKEDDKQEVLKKLYYYFTKQCNVCIQK